MQQGLPITWSGQCSGGWAAHGKADHLLAQPAKHVQVPACIQSCHSPAPAALLQVPEAAPEPGPEVGGGVGMKTG